MLVPITHFPSSLMLAGPSLKTLSIPNWESFSRGAAHSGTNTPPITERGPRQLDIKANHSGAGLMDGWHPDRGAVTNGDLGQTEQQLQLNGLSQFNKMKPVAFY